MYEVRERKKHKLIESGFPTRQSAKKKRDLDVNWYVCRSADHPRGPSKISGPIKLGDENKPKAPILEEHGLNLKTDAQMRREAKFRERLNNDPDLAIGETLIKGKS